MKKFMRTGGSRAPPAPLHLNGHATKGNGHANGAARWANGHTKHEDKHSTLSRYWAGSATTEGGRLWEDPEFPATPRSLYKHKKPVSHPVVWMRPHELCTRPVFRSEVETRGDSAECGEEARVPSHSNSSETGATTLANRVVVETGEVGDSALLVGVSALTLTPRLLERVVPPGQDFQTNYCGAFRFRFWQFGEWRDVTVDDRLPAHRGRLLCSRHTSATEFWVPLLEKAYAKLYGSYENLSQGTVSRVLQDLTGGIVQSFSLHAQDRYLTFQVLNSAVPRSSLLVATVDNEKEKRQIRLRNGLMSCQAYCITGLARVRGSGAGGDTPLVRLRNPAGRGEWSGAWSRASWEWHGLSERDKELLSVRVTHDGEFWMCFEDFARWFTRLELVHVGPDDWMSEPALHAKRPWRAVLARRRWRTGYNAGGGPQYIETTAMNPQFHVQIPRASAGKCHVVVAVAQEQSGTLKRIGFAVYEVPPQAPRLTPHLVAEQRPLDVTNHSLAREVVTFFTLPPGDYVVVPQTSVPNVDAKFLLRILTDEQTNIWEVNEDNMIIRNISAEFLEDNQLLPADLRASVARLLEKGEEIDASGLRALWKGRCTNRPSRELCRALLVLRDTNICGRLHPSHVPPLLRLLHYWQHTFASSCGRRSRTSSFNLRGLLRAAGVCASNKVLECLVLRFCCDGLLSAEHYVMALARLYLAHERYQSLDSKMKTNPLSLEEMILMTIYS